jgi:hypothetical protein
VGLVATALGVAITTRAAGRALKQEMERNAA